MNPENLKCRTFLITLSPKTDITDQTINQFKKYIEKKTQYAFIVTETGDNGKKHLHCAAIWMIDMEKRVIHDYWSKLLVKDYPGSIGRYAVKVTVMYNHDWYDEYLRKGGDIVFDNYIRDEVTKFFPTAEQQAEYMSRQGVNTEVRMHLADEMLHEWSTKEPHDLSYESAIRYVKYRMYVENRTPYYIDNRKLCQLCWFLYEKRNQILEPNTEEKNFASRMSGN